MPVGVPWHGAGTIEGGVNLASAQPTPGAWQDAFVLWNNTLLESIFSAAHRGEEVWLQIDADELDAMGRELGGDEGFLNAVKAGPPWGTISRAGGYAFGSTSDIVGRAKGLVLQRRYLRRRPSGYCDPGDFAAGYAGLNAPAYLPFLAVLVRTAAVTEDSFYAHLQHALGLPDSWTTQNLVAMEPVWKDLERWTKETNEQFGRFVFRSLGKHSRVGVPRSQSVISRKDRALLPKLFEQAGARPGQKLTTSLIGAMKQLVPQQAGFSTQFRDAVQRAAYNDIVEARLSAVFDDWDAATPSAPKAARTGEQAAARQRPQVALCMTLQGEAPPWIIHWRIPPLADCEPVTIEHSGATWQAPSLGTEATSTVEDEGDEAQAAARMLLARSGSEDIAFHAATTGEEAAPLGELALPKEILRTLTWHFNPLLRRYELRESPLPAHGAAYLLSSKANSSRLRSFLEREEIPCSWPGDAGLPEGWQLACVLDCGTLSDEQRATVPDGRQGRRSPPRPIRLVGGKSVARGGLRQYLSYDLPSVELDAPPGTQLVAEGLRFLPEGDLERSAVLRFQIEQEVAGPRLYDIVASHNGIDLGRKRLRVSGNAGEALAGGSGAFSVDPMGWPAREGGGLRGLLPSQAIAMQVDEASFEADAQDIGAMLTAGCIESASQVPMALFLDALAQQQNGSMGYGPARDLLARLQVRAGETLEPALGLRALRSRGHLEIQTDRKGHMIRVVAVEPCLYELTLRHDGCTVFGVLGTLRLQQWASLARCMGLASIRRVRRESGVQQWRVVAKDDDLFAEQALEAGFDVQSRPASPIAAWAATTERALETIGALAGESPGTAGQDAQVLSVASGYFKGLNGPVSVDPQLSCQLFRMPDLDIPALSVFVLGINSSNRQTFGFVRDSSWGKWLAIGAFGKFAKETLQIGLGSPWPIPYSPEDGSLWIPAQLGLPYVMERALILSSGASPEIKIFEVMNSQDSLDLRDTTSGATLLDVPRVYEQMVDRHHPATGSARAPSQSKWLRYRWVSPFVVETVSCKLGGKAVPVRFVGRPS